MINPKIGNNRRILNSKQIEYTLKFNKEEDNRWYIDLPEWGGMDNYLKMSAGFDQLLDFLGGNPITLSCIVSKEDEEIEGYIKLIKLNPERSLDSAEPYSVNYDGINRKLYLAPIFREIMEEYPEYNPILYLYIRKIE